MKRAQKNDTVRIHFTGKLEDGSVVASSTNHDPLQLTLGKGEVIAGVEKAVTGMALGQLKTTTIPPEEAFGLPHEQMIAVVDRSRLPADLDPSPGQRLQVPQQDGKPVAVTVTDVTESTVTLDANHPLAGKRLVFDLQLVEIL